MSAILSLIFSNGTIIAIGAALVGVIAAYMKGRVSGASAERNKQAAAETKARDVADQIDRDIGALHPDQRRKELGTWGR